MHEDIYKGKWHQFKGKVKAKWGKLTDDDITRVNGNRERMLGALQERYGWEQKRADEELKRFEQSYRQEGEPRGDSFGKGREDEGKFRTDREEDEEGGQGKPKKRKIG